MRRDLNVAVALAVAVVVTVPATATATDSNTPLDPPPLVLLGPPSSQGASLTPAGVLVELSPTRRSARVTATWSLRAPPGALTIAIPSTLFQVDFFTAPGTTPLPDEVTENVPLPGVSTALIDPSTGAVYHRGPLSPPLSGFLHRVSLTVPPSGLLSLRAVATLPSGSDRARWFRHAVESTHALHHRSDYFIYHYTLAGPGGPVQLVTPPHTAAQARYVDGALRVAAARARPFPLGLTAGIGAGVNDGVTGAAARVAMDALLPYGHALSLALDGATRFTGAHALTTSLVYQIYAPAPPLLPIAAHLDLGPALSVWPDLRPGLRLGLGLHFSWAGVLASADLLPEHVPPGPLEAGAGHYDLHYRIAVLLAFAL